jgi:zinc-ribbon domain
MNAFCPRCGKPTEPDDVFCRNCGLRLSEEATPMAEPIPQGPGVAQEPPPSFAPTHRVPEGGTRAWVAPDPSAHPATVLNAGVDLSVLGWNGAWAQVGASNGWQGWVDGRVLVPIPAARADTASWMPTHAVPAGGASAWSNPDPSVPPEARLETGAQLRLIETQGAWARVIGANGWTGWVDGRYLVPVGGGGTGVLGIFALIGATLVIGGSFLPLLSFGGLSLSAWQLPLLALIADSPAATGLRTGAVLLIVLVAALPVVTRRRLPTALAVAIGVLTAGLAVVALIRSASLGQQSTPGVGLFMILAGGILVIVDAVRGRR